MGEWERQFFSKQKTPWRLVSAGHGNEKTLGRRENKKGGKEREAMRLVHCLGLILLVYVKRKLSIKSTRSAIAKNWLSRYDDDKTTSAGAIPNPTKEKST